MRNETKPFSGNVRNGATHEIEDQDPMSVLIDLAKQTKNHLVILADCAIDEVQGTIIFAPGAPARHGVNVKIVIEQGEQE